MNTLFRARHVHRLGREKGDANSILVDGGRVIAIDRFDSLKDADTKVVDLGEATITPGLTDAHIHITEWAVARKQVGLGEALSIDEAARLVADHHGEDGTAEWILGRGWNPHHWGGEYPHRSALDAIAPKVPVVLQSHDMHALWTNSAALRIAGINESTDDPEGGRILRDTDGQPSGVLLENAAQLVSPHLPRYTVSSIIPHVIDAQRELHSYGITGIHSFPGVHLRDPDPFPVLQTMLAEGTLALRVLQHIPLDVLDDAIRVGLRSGFGNEWLRIGAVKMFLDGALGSRTAWMREPYEGSDDCGVQVLAENDFRSAVKRAASNGIATTVHAIGDAAVALAFEVLNDKQLAVRGWPHRVEHVQCLAPETLIGEHVICSVQP
ncbi:MAG TPA: amidohydrolase family protein, partial [Longimicrobiales bacterium]|nr:amidohydrolase family protein [Longimicrobiales bacterium]